MQRLMCSFPKTVCLAMDTRFILGAILSWHAIMKVISWINQAGRTDDADEASRNMQRIQDDIITLKLSLTKLRVESRLLAGKLAKLITSDQPWSVHPSGTLNDHYLNELLLHSSRESHAIPYREDDDLNAASVPHDPNINHSITIMGCRDDASQLQKLRQENSLLKYALESLKRENQEMGARLVEMAFSSGAGAVINERGSQNWQQVESHDPISALSGSLHGIEGEELASSSSSVGCAGSSSPIPEGPMTPLQLRDIESLKISNNLEE